MAGFQKAQEGVAEKMFKAVRRIIDTLDDPEYTAFHDTMIKSIKEIIEDMESAEFLDDIMMRPHIKEIRELADEKLGGYSTIALKASEKKRRECREGAKEVAARISELLS